MGQMTQPTVSKHWRKTTFQSHQVHTSMLQWYDIWGR